jgi:hypothetical protein
MQRGSSRVSPRRAHAPTCFRAIDGQETAARAGLASLVECPPHELKPTAALDAGRAQACQRQCPVPGRRRTAASGGRSGRGTPRGATPPTPPGIRVTYHGGSTGLSLVKNMKSRATERVEVVVAQGLLDRRVSRHAPEPCRRTGGDRCLEL